MNEKHIVGGILGLVSIIGLKTYFTSQTQKPNLEGKVAVITDGNSNIGKQLIQEFISMKCKVIFGSKQFNQEFIRQIISVHPHAEISCYWLDAENRDSMREFTRFVGENLKASGYSSIDYLINNSKGYLSSFYATYLLWEKFSHKFTIINTNDNLKDLEAIRNIEKDEDATFLFSKEIQRKINKKGIHGKVISVDFNGGGFWGLFKSSLKQALLNCLKDDAIGGESYVDCKAIKMKENYELLCLQFWMKCEQILNIRFQI